MYLLTHEMDHSVSEDYFTFPAIILGVDMHFSLMIIFLNSHFILKQTKQIATQHNIIIFFSLLSCFSTRLRDNKFLWDQIHSIVQQI